MNKKSKTVVLASFYPTKKKNNEAKEKLKALFSK